jgi:hypothetical protein
MIFVHLSDVGIAAGADRMAVLDRQDTSPRPQTICWMVIFFFASRRR